jgi:Flp pilus assembly protein protease CpaA
MLHTVVLLGLTLVAAVTDVLRGKIYNWNTYGGIVAGLALGAAHSAWWPADGGTGARPGSWLFWPGAPLWYDSLGGLLFCGALLVVCYAYFPGISGGDVKLMGMIGALLGWEKGLEAMLWSFVLAACFSLVFLTWRVGPVTTASRVARLMAAKMRLPWFLPLSDEERKVLKPPIFLAHSALAAVVIVRFDLIDKVFELIDKAFRLMK